MSSAEDIIEDLEESIKTAIQVAKSKVYKLQVAELSSKRQRKSSNTQSTGKYILVYQGKNKLVKPQQNDLLETVKEYLKVTEGTTNIDYKILDSKRNLIYKNTNKG